MRYPALGVLALSLVTACSVVQYRDAGEDTRALVERFSARTASSFQLLNSIVFEYNWRAFSGIGYVDIDRSSGRFKVVCLTPLGVKLFELSGDGSTVTDLYTIAAFRRFGDVTATAGADIRRIYFDLIPSAQARIWRTGQALRFRESRGAGTMEYVFAFPGGDLVEKNYYGDDGLAWRATYRDYHEEQGKRYPRLILFQNYRYGYRLTVREKEFHP